MKCRMEDLASSSQGNRIWSLRLLKADGASWRSGAINSDRGCRNGEEPASVRSFARSKGSSASNHLPNFSYAIALGLIQRGGDIVLQMLDNVRQTTIQPIIEANITAGGG